MQIRKLVTIFDIEFENKNSIKNTKMKLSQVALERIRDRKNKKVKIYLALALDKSVQSIYRYIEDNSDDLTKAAALAVIRKETGLSDQEILEEENEEVASL